MTEVAADVLSGLKAFGIEAVGRDLKTAMVAVALLNGQLQRLVMGTGLPEALAEQDSTENTRLSELKCKELACRMP